MGLPGHNAPPLAIKWESYQWHQKSKTGVCNTDVPRMSACIAPCCMEMHIGL